MDCGQPIEEIACFRGFIVRKNTRYTCEAAGSRGASCVNDTQIDYLDWCRPNEACIPGLEVCQPKKLTCNNGQRDKGEDGVDCGGNCKPCPSCNDGVKNADEQGVDCGGSCKPCYVECSSDKSCGLAHWGQPICQDDNTVVQEYISYTCISPGTTDSWCRKDRITKINDYCGPLVPCESGACVRGNETGLMKLPPYKCRRQDPCFDEPHIKRKCIGDLCIDLRVIS